MAEETQTENAEPTIMDWAVAMDEWVMEMAG
jgi:hypothetical protein